MNKKIKYIIIAIIILLLVGFVEIIIFSQKKENDTSSINAYHFTGKIKEADDIIIYSNPQLKASHCLNYLCIENASFYYNSNSGRVEYTIHNLSNSVYDGYLKMVFQEQSLIVSIKNLAAGESIKSSSYYLGIEINNKEDYLLQELTEEEKSKIVKPIVKKK